MILTKPYIIEMDEIDRESILRKIESAARNCYQSKMSGDLEGTSKFVRGLVKSGHMAPVELGGMINVKIRTSRSVLAELSRHRLIAMCCESQRYVNPTQNKFGIEFIIPYNITVTEPEITDGYYEIGMVPIKGPAGQMGVGLQIATATLKDGQLGIVRQVRCKEATGFFLQSLAASEQSYIGLIQMGYKPQDAREVLPNATACTITMGANLREWKHIFNLRVFGTTGKPYPPCKEIMSQVYEKFHAVLPEIFPDEIPNDEPDKKSEEKKPQEGKKSILLGADGRSF